ncbi:unnamed protein product [Didymodactylos carnosus]|uniref:IF rod domain-containing protein n=1 Tax=Didymodactylos carnosus TaxID=1234261 RepID=A0A813QXD8_9BILA|nr:unnamed protein product [Didymodactylos carnosus]CAF0926003.1 unnamed protein product [Didymodactylos carnosus]CAF3555790.1 unnamed protein product [Didymodactylos carnosus]CAF3703097.1 unnamed protein product [Didymodactylos carnosus]
MFSAFKRRTALASTSDLSMKGAVLRDSPSTITSSKTDENCLYITPTISTGEKNNNNLKQIRGRTFSGHSLASSSSSTLTTSPLLNITRQQEKEELQTLNDRLAIIIDTVRRLEQENSKLKEIHQTIHLEHTVKVSNIKSLYDRELESSKKLIDDIANEKALQDIENGKLKKTVYELTEQLQHKLEGLNRSEVKMKKLEQENYELKYQNEALKIAHDETQPLHLQIGELDQKYKLLEKLLEDETLKRVNAENKCKTLDETIQFKESMYNTELNQVRQQQRTKYDRIDDSLKQEYDTRFFEELKSLRDETDQRIQEMRIDVEQTYHQKLFDFDATQKRLQEQIQQYRQDLVDSRMRSDELIKGRNDAQEKLQQLEERSRNNDQRFQQQQERYETILAERDQEIEKLNQQVQNTLDAYQSLLDLKIGLDREIGTYRKLLEVEEERLNISSLMRQNDSSIAVIANDNYRSENDGDHGSLFFTSKINPVMASVSETAIMMNDGHIPRKRKRLANINDNHYGGEL